MISPNGESETGAPGSTSLHANDFYDAHASAYAGRTANAAPPPLFEDFAGMVTPGGAIIDLGCGAGRDLARLSAAGFNCSGIDLSVALAEYAKANSGVDVAVADMRNFRSPDASLDGVIAIASLLHLAHAELDVQLASIARWLKPNGLLLATMKIGEATEHSQDGRLYSLVTLDAWLAMLAGAGLTPLARSFSAANPDVSNSPHPWISVLARKQ